MALRRTIRLNQDRGNRISSAPAVEPVTAAELREHLRESADGLSDSEANGLITEARQWIEDHINTALITQTWVMTIDRWPGGTERWWDGVKEAHIDTLSGDGHLVDLEIPRWPLQSISGVNVYDEDGTETAVTVADVFDVDAQSIPGRITLQRGATWPVALRANNAIQITYISGYGDAASDVPAPLKRSVKQLASALYANRGDGCDKAADMSGVKSMLGTYKVQRV